MPLNHPHSTTLNCSPWERSAWAHRVTVLGAISDANTYQTPIPPDKVGNKHHYISGRFKVGSWWLVNAYYSHPIPAPEGGGGSSPQYQGVGYGYQGGPLWAQRGSVQMMQGDGSRIESGGIYDRGELAASYRWTGWVREITGWSSRLQETYQSF
jgi:hypothetical protein